MVRRCVTRKTNALVARQAWGSLVGGVVRLMGLSMELFQLLLPTAMLGIRAYEETGVDLYEATFHKPRFHLGRCRTLDEFEDKLGSDAVFEHYFRLDKRGCRDLLENIGLPGVVLLDHRPRTPHSNGFKGFRYTGAQILLMVLYKLATPCRGCDLSLFFGRTEKEGRLAVKFGLRFIHDVYGDGFGDPVAWKCGNVETHVWAFVDVNCRIICRPGSFVVNGVAVDVHWHVRLLG